MKDNKQRASKALMILILVMYINDSARVSLNWYLGWLTYVKYSGSEDQALAVFFSSEETSLTVLNMLAATNLLTTLGIGIADSIMVIHFSLVDYLIQANYLGLAVLDHL